MYRQLFSDLLFFSVLCGPQIEAEHCIFHHSNVEVQLIPLEGARCSVNNNRIHEATKLSQGQLTYNLQLIIVFPNHCRTTFVIYIVIFNFKQ